MELFLDFLQVFSVIASSFCVGVTIIVLFKLTEFRAPKHVAFVASGFLVIATVCAIHVYTGSLNGGRWWLPPLAIGFGLVSAGLIVLLRGKHPSQQ